MSEVLAQGKDVLTVEALVADVVHDGLHEMDAEPADAALLNGERGVDVGLGCGVEGDAGVGDDNGHALVVGLDANVGIALGTSGIGIGHDVDDGLLEGQVELHGGGHVDTQLLAHAVDERGQLWHLVHVVGQYQTAP